MAVREKLERLKKFNEPTIKALPAPASGNVVYFVAKGVEIRRGQELPRGLGVRVTAAGARSFIMQYRQDGKVVRQTLGVVGAMICTEAADKAWAIRRALGSGKPVEAPKRGRTAASEPAEGDGEDDGRPTVGAVLDDFIKAYVRPELRSAVEVERLIEKDIRPALGDKKIHDVRRSHINAMLSAIRSRGEDKKRSGKVTAERTLSVLRKCFNWYATESHDPHSDEFASPIAKGMARVKAEERAERIGRRVLCKDRKGQGSDDELQVLWWALERPEEGEKGTRNGSGERLPIRYPAFIRTLVYTAQRRGEVAGMHEREILDRGKDDWLWIIPRERYKTKREQLVPLSRQVVAELKALDVKPGGKRYVFTVDGKHAFSDFSGPKSALNKRMEHIRKKVRRKPIPNFGLHDLRRTSRPLMSRTETVMRDGKKVGEIPAVPVAIAEMCLGHVPPGLVDTYDQHDYLDEMRAALQLLADRIDRIVGW